MTVFGVSIEGFRQFSTVFGIRTELGGAKGALIVARESAPAICGGNEVRSCSHGQVYARSEYAADSFLRYGRTHHAVKPIHSILDCSDREARGACRGCLVRGWAHLSARFVSLHSVQHRTTRIIPTESHPQAVCEWMQNLETRR